MAKKKLFKRVMVNLPEALITELDAMAERQGRARNELVRECLWETVIHFRNERQRLYPEPKATQGYAGRPIKPVEEKQIDKMIQEADAFWLLLQEKNPTALEYAQPWLAHYNEAKATRNHGLLKVFDQETRGKLAAHRLMDAAERSAFEEDLSQRIAEAKNVAKGES